MFAIETRLTIKPWFTQSTLRAADALSEADDCLLLYYRNGCAAIFPEIEGYCLMLLAEAKQISQGFRPLSVECSICNHTQRLGDHCVHAAVLLGKVLVDDRTREDLNRPPVPLVFKDSPWQSLCTFMNEKGRFLQVTQDTQSNSLTFKTVSFTLRTVLPERTKALLPLLSEHWGIPPVHGPDPKKYHGDSVRSARDKLFQFCRSDTEKTLNQCGRNSKGQDVSGSLWTQLCHHYCQNEPQPDWQLIRSTDNFFSLTASLQNGATLCLTPCREETVPLLARTDAMPLTACNGKAQAYSKIFFQENGGLVIEPWLKLDTGETFRREDVAEMIFGKYCSFGGALFQEIKEQEDNFSSFQQPVASLPLFAFAQSSAAPTTIVIPDQDVPSFLDTYQQALASGRHDCDPSLENFCILDLPEAITVKNYYEKDDWCYLSAMYSCGNRDLDIREIVELRARGQRHAAAKERWLQVKDTPLDWLYKLAPERIDENDPNEHPMRLTRLEMMALTTLVPELKLPDRKDIREQIREQLGSFEGQALAEADIPPHLRPYQRTGFAWLHHLYQNGIGGILADDMGLGKTHQALALIQLLLRSGRGPILVVCPASVLPHWQDKIADFYPEIDPSLYYGAQRNLTQFNPSSLLLTTYGVMRQDVQHLRQYSFGLIIYDEIQSLKNPQNATSQAADLLNGQVAFGLSGTPIENSLMDLKSLYDLCLPGLLGGESSFRKTYVEPIEEGQNQQRLATLKRLISPFMLRRHKTAVLDELPDIIEDVRHCYLSPDQQRLYQQAIDHEGRALLEAVNDTSAPFPHMNFLALIQQLKQICNHPCQLIKSSSYQKFASGKWDLFLEILSECLDAGLKVVVFSQYTTMLDLIERYLRDMEISYGGLRGNTPMAKRQQRVAAFNNDPEIKVFCASLLAGGTGIDLTGAQAVIHYDRWWNAAKEEQATARVHRMGQKQAVQVFKLVTTGTLEEKIHSMISAKQDLADNTITCDDGSIIKQLSREDITSILRWGA